MTIRISFPERLAQLAAERGDAVAITWIATDGRTENLSWQGLEKGAERLSRHLAARGVGQGTMVVIGLANCIEHFILAYAAWRCGACVVSLSARAPEREFTDTLALLDNRFVVADKAGADLDHDGLRALIADGSADGTPAPMILSNPGKATVSGGSTGRPKIIVWPYPWVRGPGDISDIQHVGLRSNQIQLVSGPLYHNAPFSWAHFGLFEGHHLVVLERFDAARVVETIEKWRCEFMFLAPPMLLRMARLPDIDKRDLSSIAGIFVTAASCPVWLKERWIGLVGAAKIQESYGSSEALGYTHISGDEALEHPGSVGRAGDGDLRILDSEFNEVPVGTVGEIFFRPTHYPNPTYAYIGAEPVRTTPAGYMSVGDLGHVDADGWLYIADRRNDLIITGGVNVYPSEVEAALVEHPDIADAAVVGLPDEDWGRRVHAIVEPSDAGNAPGVDVLLAWLRERLSPAKIPKSIEFITTLPRDQSGKIRRSALLDERSAQTGGAAQ